MERGVDQTPTIERGARVAYTSNQTPLGDSRHRFGDDTQYLCWSGYRCHTEQPVDWLFDELGSAWCNHADSLPEAAFQGAGWSVVIV